MTEYVPPEPVALPSPAPDLDARVRALPTRWRELREYLDRVIETPPDRQPVRRVVAGS